MGLEKLAENGLLGLLLALAIAAIIYLYKENQSLQNKRIEDARRIRQDLIEPLKAIEKAIDTLSFLVREELQSK